MMEYSTIPYEWHKLAATKSSVLSVACKIAHATIMEPAVLLADEPTGNLDRASGKEVIEILEHLNQKGIVLIVVTHDPEIGGRARRQIRLVDGRITNDISGHEKP